MPPNFLKRPPKPPRCRGEELASATRNLATLLGGGIPLTAALEVLLEQTEPGGLYTALQQVTRRIQAGNQLSRSLAELPSIFNRSYVAMVAIGEESGQLQDSIEKLAVWLERDHRNLSRLRSALIYPGFILLTALALTGLFFYAVMPSLLSVFDGFQMELPWITRALLWVTVQMRNPWAWALALLAGYELGRWFVKNHKTPEFCRALRALPWIGPALEVSFLLRFAAAMGSLLQVGVTLTRSWVLAAEVCGNPELVGDARRVVDGIAQGDTMEDLLRHPLYPGQFRQMLEVGNESGRLADMLAFLVTIYEIELAQRLEILSTLLEPLFLAVMAAGVTTIILAVMLPLYAILTQM